MSALVPPPPQITVAYSGAEGEGAAVARGSYGPVIAMLAVLAVLAAVAVAVGRLCFGRRALGRAGGHDLEAWVEQKCGPCVGAGVRSSAPAATSHAGGAGETPDEEGGDCAAPAELQEQPPEGMERGECSGGAGGS